MKRSAAFFCLSLLTAGLSLAQTFSFSPGKTHSITINFQEASYDGITFTNISSLKQGANWTLLSKDTLPDCGFGMCSSGYCWTNVPLTGKFPMVDTGDIGWLKLHCYSGTTNGTNKLVFLFDDGNVQYDTLTFFIHISSVAGIGTNGSASSPSPFRITSNTGSSLEAFVSALPAPGATFSVASITGAVVLEQEARQGENLLNTSGLANGLYLLTYRDAKGVHTKKFVKAGA